MKRKNFIHPTFKIQPQHIRREFFGDLSSDILGSIWAFRFLSAGTDFVHVLWCLVTNSEPQQTTSAGRDLHQPPSPTSWPTQSWQKLKHWGHCPNVSKTLGSLEALWLIFNEFRRFIWWEGICLSNHFIELCLHHSKNITEHKVAYLFRLKAELFPLEG